MRVLYQDFAKKSGAQASYKLLLQAMAFEFPDDEYIIVCNKESFFYPLGKLSNVQVIPFYTGFMKEMSRFYLEMSGIGRIARKHKADVIWTSNVGPYVRTGVPQLLMVLNSYQVYPWSVVRYHPRTRLTVAALRWFFRRSLRCCDGVQVETPLMGEYVRRIPGAPRRIEAIPKAVESSQDFESQPLSAGFQKMFDGGLGHSAFTFLFVATNMPHKNHATVVAAMDILRSRGVAARLALTVNEIQLRQLCNARLVSSLIESGHVLPLGWIDKEKLAALYEACDGCVMPSKLEQLSSAHLEAMHWQKPQISADLPYARALCGDAAIYADPEDQADWAAKMQLFAENAELRGHLVAAGLDLKKTFPETWREVARRQRAYLAEIAKGVSA